MEKIIEEQQSTLQELKDIRRRIGQENKCSRTVEKAKKWSQVVEEKWSEVVKRHKIILSMENADKTGYVTEMHFEAGEEIVKKVQLGLKEWQVDSSSSGASKPVRELIVTRSVKLAVLVEVVGRYTRLLETSGENTAEIKNVEAICQSLSTLLSEFLIAHENIPNSVEEFTTFEQEAELISAETVTLITSLNLKIVNSAKQFENHSTVGESQGDHSSKVESIGNGLEMKEILSLFKELLSTNRGPNSNIKLPTLTIPTFDGNLIKGQSTWKEFKGAFESAVHHNDKVDKISKFRYLKSYLVGEPKNLVGQFEYSEANYDTAWGLLLRRYNNKRMLIKVYLTQLLAVPKAKAESAAQLKSTVDEFKEALFSLQNMGEVLNNSMSVHVLSSKLPDNTLQLWEQTLGNSEDIPAFEKLDEFLEGRIRTLTVLETSEEKREVKAKVSAEQECPLCEGEHLLFKCRDFKWLDVERRNEIVKTKGLCSTCLKDHKGAACNLRLTCSVCKAKHNTLLHRPADAQSMNLNIDSKYTLLPTAMITLISNHGIPFTVKALVDQGSSSSAVSESLMSKLKWKRTAGETIITGIGGIQTTGNGSVKFLLNSRIDPELQIPVSATIMGKVSTALPEFRKEVHEEFRGLPLADPTYHKGGRIDIILGSDVYPEILLGRMIQGSLLAQETHLGYIISGPTDKRLKSQMSFLCQRSEPTTEECIRKFWETEEKCKHHDGLTDEERAAEHVYATTTVRGENGRYVCRLPFKPKMQLGKSHHIAMSNLLSLEKRLNKDEQFKMRFSAAMQEYFELKHAHLADQVDLNKPHCFLPYLAVTKESSSTTKTRIVFNASSPTSNGKSLNDILMVGPTIQHDLVEKLILFRLEKYVFSCDIEKMYRQITVHPEDHKFQLFLWRIDGVIRNCYLSTVTFGTASAPFVAIRTLAQLAYDLREQFPIGSQIISTKAYVDDIHYGSDSIEQTRIGVHELIGILKAASFEVRKFASNDKRVLEGMPEEMLETNDTHRFVGLVWNSREDVLKLNPIEFIKEAKMTKRTILKNIARIFDPIGWFQPIIIRAKILMQVIWKSGLDWDAEVPTSIVNEWINIEESVKALEGFAIPRYVFQGPKEHIEVHGFADASQLAYGAVIYIKIGSSSPSVILAKSRVAPIKPTSIPRLELKAALLLSDITRKVVELLKSEGHQITCFGWSDSKVVIAWLSSSSIQKWKPFVRNRVATIIESIPGDRWKYVASAENPADMVSRGCDAETLLSSQLWFHGPSWLGENNANYRSISVDNLEPSEIEKIEEEQQKEVRIMTAQENENSWIVNLAQKYSNFGLSCRVLAWVRRFISNCREKTKTRHVFITVDENKRAEEELIRGVQGQHFEMEINCLFREKCVARDSSLRHLNPFLDGDGTLRVGGRIQKSLLPFQQRHPMIVPAKGGLVGLIVEETHRAMMHGGVQVTLNALRKKFWLVRGGQFVKGVLRGCIICAKNRRTPATQLMGNLPLERVTFSKAFLHTGVDFAGPFMVRASGGRGIKTVKAYIAVFVCFAVKAFHLEVVSSLSSDSFMAALSRFRSRRGRVDKIYSDNGTNFVGAFRQLNEIHNKLAQKGIEWSFIPPLSPNFGGLWEAGVKSVKRHLFSQCRNESFTFEELSTLLCEVEICLNARPLCPLVDDVESLDVLTPQHFMTQSLLPDNLDDRNLVDVKQRYLSRWEQLKKIRQEITIRYKTEYITRLNNRPKHCTEKSNIRVGQLVLLREDSAKPSEWPVGRIIEVCPGTDGLVRVVRVKTGSGVKERSLSRICPIHLQSPTNGMPIC